MPWANEFPTPFIDRRNSRCPFHRRSKGTWRPGSPLRTAPTNVREAKRQGARPRPTRRILFASAHSIIDFSNGASVATLDVLEGLTAAGFDCQAFCTSKLDLQTEVCFEDVVSVRGRARTRFARSVCGEQRARVLYTRREPRARSRSSGSTRPGTSPSNARRSRPSSSSSGRSSTLPSGRHAHLWRRPDHGRDDRRGKTARDSRRLCPAQLRVHPAADSSPTSIIAWSPPQFARRHYRDRVGLECHALPYTLDWDRVRATRREPRFVTFVNPCLEKGVYAFARIAHELGRRRPDIPLLVVESRGTSQHLGACGLDLAAAGNIQIMPHTTDPRRFWNVTKIALVPSLWWENQPLVVIEAMINGIPVIGSDRGGIPETLGAGGLVLPLPGR